MAALLKAQKKALLVLGKLEEVVRDQSWDYIKDQIQETIKATQIPYKIENLNAKTTRINIRHPDSYMGNCRELMLAVNDWFHTGMMSEICETPKDQYKEKIDRKFSNGLTTQDKTTHCNGSAYYCHYDWFNTKANELCAFCDDTGDSLIAPVCIWNKACRDRNSYIGRAGNVIWIPRRTFILHGGSILPIHPKLQDALKELQKAK